MCTTNSLMRLWLTRALLLAALLVGTSAAAWGADFYSLTIDSSQSSLTVSGDIEGAIPLQEQLPGSLTSQLAGGVNIFYEPAFPWFYVNSASVAPVPHAGPFLPGNTGADFATIVPEILPGITAYATIRNAQATASSNYLYPDGSGNFTVYPNDVYLSFTSGVFEWYVPPVTSGYQYLSGFYGYNTTYLTGRLKDLGANVEVRLPLDIELSLLTDLGLVANVHLVGTIVARSAIPEPSTLVLGCLGAAGMAVVLRRRQRTARGC